MLDTNRENDTKAMLHLVEEEFAKHIEKLAWFDEPTRKAAEAKLDKVTGLIGGPKKPRSYPFTLSPTAYFDNIEKIALDSWTKTIYKISKPVDKRDWTMAATEPNAYYSDSTNQIVFLAAILQPPMLNDSATQHKTSVRFYDGDGNQVGSWSEKSSEQFNLHAQCLSDQYSTFAVNGTNGTLLGYVDGNLTITENIADCGGLNLSFNAFHTYMQNALAKSSEDDQLFFVVYGQMWCQQVRDRDLVNQMSSDPHSPAKWRVNGAVTNRPDFSRVFKCTPDSPMNPETKCGLW